MFNDTFILFYFFISVYVFLFGKQCHQNIKNRKPYISNDLCVFEQLIFILFTNNNGNRQYYRYRTLGTHSVLVVSQRGCVHLSLDDI